MSEHRKENFEVAEAFIAAGAEYIERVVENAELSGKPTTVGVMITAVQFKHDGNWYSVGFIKNPV